MSHFLFTVVALQLGWDIAFPGPGRFSRDEPNYRELLAVESIFVLKNDRFGPFILPADKPTILSTLESVSVSLDVRVRADEVAKRELLPKRDSFQFHTGQVFNQAFVDMEHVFHPKASLRHPDSNFFSEQYFPEEEYDPATLSRNWNAARRNQDIVAGWMLNDRHHWLCIDPYLWYFDATIVPDYQIWRTDSADESRPTSRIEESDRTAWILEWLSFYLRDNGSSRFDSFESIRNWRHILWRDGQSDIPRIRFR